MRLLAVVAIAIVGGGCSGGASSDSSGPFAHVKATLRRYDIDKKNPKSTYLTVSFDYRGSSGSKLGYKCACRVGDVVLVDVSSMREKEESTPFVIDPLPEEPDECELTLTDHWDYRSPPARDAVFCLQRGGAIESHACSPPIVKSVPPPTTPAVPMALADVKVSMSESITNRPSLLVEWRVIATGPHSPEAETEIVTRCLDHGGLVVADSGCFGGWGALAPGESKRCGTLPHTGRFISASPSQCDVTFQSKDSFSSPPVDIATYCFRPPAQLSQGPCP